MDVVGQFTAGGVYAFMLTLARISGLFLMAPVFSSRLIPVRAKLTIALGVTLAAAPIAAGEGTVPADVARIAVLVVKEVIVGSAIAFAVGLVFAAVTFAGGLIDLTVGFAFANVVDPVNNAQISTGNLTSCVDPSFSLSRMVTGNGTFVTRPLSPREMIESEESVCSK